MDNMTKEESNTSKRSKQYRKKEESDIEVENEHKKKKSKKSKHKKNDRHRDKSRKRKSSMSERVNSEVNHMLHKFSKKVNKIASVSESEESLISGGLPELKSDMFKTSLSEKCVSKDASVPQLQNIVEKQRHNVSKQLDSIIDGELLQFITV